MTASDSVASVKTTLALVGHTTVLAEEARMSRVAEVTVGLRVVMEATGLGTVVMAAAAAAEEMVAAANTA
jgi:hypothetical protein